MRCFFSVEVSEMGLLPVDVNVSSPPLVAAIPKATFKASPSHNFFIPHILFVRSFAQIYYAVVRTLQVDVVELFWRELAVNVEPYQPMNEIPFAIDLNRSISFGSVIPGALSD